MSHRLQRISPRGELVVLIVLLVAASGCGGTAPEPAAPARATVASAPVAVPAPTVAPTTDAVPEVVEAVETPAATAVASAPPPAPTAALQRPTATLPAPTAPLPTATAAAPKPTAPPAPVPTATAPPPAPPTATAPPPTAAAPASATKPKVTIEDPGGKVAIKAPKSGLKRVGVERCGTCHEVQEASWRESGHGKRDPPIDCEDCHGPGSEYKKSAVMKDEALWKKAGLVVFPGKEFCAKCHADPWSDDMLKNVHEHGKVTTDEEEEE